MSEKQHKAVRIISIIALVAGIAMFLCGLVLVPFSILLLVRGSVGSSDSFGYLLFGVSFYSIRLFMIPALVLSLVTLLFERNKYYQWLPLAFVVAGILLYLSCCLCIYIENLRFLSGQPPPPPPPPP